MATPDLDRFLTYRLHRIAKISDRDSAAAYQAELGLSLSEGRCLAAVGQFEPASVKDIARLANLDKANASRAADALVAALHAAGFDAALVDESGGGAGLGWAGVRAAIEACGRWAAPVPLPDTMAAAWRCRSRAKGGCCGGA